MSTYNYPDYMKKWRAANKERLAAQRRARYEAHKSEEIANAMAWNKANPYLHKLCKKMALAHKRYPGKITIQDMFQIVANAGSKCHWCKKVIDTSRDFTLEHLQPLNSVETLTIACASCNSAKLHTGKRERKLTLEESRKSELERKRCYYQANKERISVQRRELTRLRKLNAE